MLEIIEYLVVQLNKPYFDIGPYKGIYIDNQVWFLEVSLDGANYRSASELDFLFASIERALFNDVFPLDYYIKNHEYLVQVVVQNRKVVSRISLDKVIVLHNKGFISRGSFLHYLGQFPDLRQINISADDIIPWIPANNYALIYQTIIRGYKDSIVKTIIPELLEDTYLYKYLTK